MPKLTKADAARQLDIALSTTMIYTHIVDNDLETAMRALHL